MINIDNISFSYPEKNVISNLSPQIHKNSRICLFGESGCGKTTLLKLILGLLTPSSGIIHGIDSLKPSVVFQENRLLPFKSVMENITLIGSNQETALKHLKALGLEEFANSRPKELSGGMQRRAAIARALSADFDFLVLDEPFTGLDDANIKTCANHILNTAKHRPIILVTHSLAEAELFGAQIINM